MTSEVRQSKILVVDDKPANVMLLEQLLEEEGYKNVISTTDSREVVNLYVEEKVDMILLDIRMPGDLDGFEACEQLKADPITRDIPIIFITVEDEKVTIVRAFERGAVDYIVKPFEKRRELLFGIRRNNIFQHRGIVQNYTFHFIVTIF